MTVKIEILGEYAKDALSELRDLAEGLFASTALTPSAPTTATEVRIRQDAEPAVKAALAETDEGGQSSGFTETTDERLRGKASGGRARRTKDEIAKDEQLEKLAVAAGVPIEQVDNALNNGILRATVVSELEAKVAKGNMGADPENRTGPEDAPEVQEQDKADEQAEVEANREPEKPLTLDDVKSAMTAYVAKFQIAATQEDGPKIFADVLGAPPAGEPSWKLSLLASADQATLQKVIEAWIQAAGGSARYKAGA